MSDNRPLMKMVFKNKETNEKAECGVVFANQWGGGNIRHQKEVVDGKYPKIPYVRALELAEAGKGWINLESARGRGTSIAVLDESEDEAPF